MPEGAASNVVRGSCSEPPFEGIPGITLSTRGLPKNRVFFCFPSHRSGLIRCSFYGHTNVSRKLVDERMKGTNVRLEYSPERLAWHRWHLHQRMAVTSAHLDGSFTGTELDFALDVCNGVVDVLGSWLGRCNWGWLMSKLASDFHRVGKRSVLRTFRKAHLVIQKKLGRKEKISFCTFCQVLFYFWMAEVATNSWAAGDPQLAWDCGDGNAQRLGTCSGGTGFEAKQNQIMTSINY